MRLTPGDMAQAEVLCIAEEWLKRQGWKFGPSGVGKRAREILDAMDPRAALQEQER